MLTIVMLVQNRPRLAGQAIKSLIDNTIGDWRLTVMDDGSSIITEALLKSWPGLEPRIYIVRNEIALGPGKARNRGIEQAEAKWGRGEWLYLCDSDCYFKPGWDKALTDAFPEAEKQGYRVLAGYCHPYNQTNASTPLANGATLHEKYAVGLLSWLWKWETWDKYGPFEPAPQANFSEDWAMCHKIRLDGGKVGCVWPWVVANTGLTGSSGKVSPGSELIYQQPDLPEGLVIL